MSTDDPRETPAPGGHGDPPEPNPAGAWSAQPGAGGPARDEDEHAATHGALRPPPEAIPVRDAPAGAAPHARFLLRGPERPVVGPLLIALNVLWFLWMIVHGVSAFEPGAEDGLRFGANHGPAVVAGEWWRLLSAAFVHYGVLHLAMNMWAVWVLAPLAERLYGRGAFLLLYLLGAVGCSCASMLMKPEVFSAGASGAVFATMGGIFVFFLLHRREMPPGVFAAMMRQIGLNLVLGLTNPNIDNAGHFGGLVAGIAAGWCLDRDPQADPRLDAKRAGAALFLAVMLGGLCAFIPGRVAKSPRAGSALALSRAEEALQRSDWGAVEEHASTALRLAPDDADALQLRALARAALNQPDAALSDCDLALRADPSSAEALRLRAVLRSARGELAAGRQDLERLVELLPSNATARRFLGQCQLALGDAKAAAVTLEAAVKLDEPRSGEAQLWLWMARAELGLRAEADAGLDAFARGAFGQDLDAPTARAIDVALRGTAGDAEDEPELRRVVRAVRALHPASGAPDPAAARAELGAVERARPDPWLAALAQRLRDGLAR